MENVSRERKSMTHPGSAASAESFPQGVFQPLVTIGAPPSVDSDTMS